MQSRSWVLDWCHSFSHLKFVPGVQVESKSLWKFGVLRKCSKQTFFQQRYRFLCVLQSPLPLHTHTWMRSVVHFVRHGCRLCFQRQAFDVVMKEFFLLHGSFSLQNGRNCNKRQSREMFDKPLNSKVWVQPAQNLFWGTGRGGSRWGAGLGEWPNDNRNQPCSRPLDALVFHKPRGKRITKKITISICSSSKHLRKEVQALHLSHTTKITPAFFTICTVTQTVIPWSGLRGPRLHSWVGKTAAPEWCACRACKPKPAGGGGSSTAQLSQWKWTKLDRRESDAPTVFWPDLLQKKTLQVQNFPQRPPNSVDQGLELRSHILSCAHTVLE